MKVDVVQPGGITSELGPSPKPPPEKLVITVVYAQATGFICQKMSGKMVSDSAPVWNFFECQPGNVWKIYQHIITMFTLICISHTSIILDASH